MALRARQYISGVSLMPHPLSRHVVALLVRDLGGQLMEAGHQMTTLADMLDDM